MTEICDETPDANTHSLVTAPAEVAVRVKVEVVLAMPEAQYQVSLTLAPNTSARQAVRLALEAGLIPMSAKLDAEPMTAALGVFGECVEDTYCCQAGDRIEIYRPLQQDPKELRRQRARQSIS